MLTLGIRLAFGLFIFQFAYRSSHSNVNWKT